MATASPVYDHQPIGTGVPEIIRLPEKFSKQPMNLTCNVCHTSVQTSTTESCNPICCVIFGCCALCCCQNVEHKCPKCNAVLGTHKAI